MENKISIPKPCHENWEAMLPEEQGRHCLSCCKTVVDFSTWDNDSILAYLKQRNNERVCGRFHTAQVDFPAAPEQQALLHQVVYSGMPMLRKIAAIIILCFGLSSLQDVSAQKLMGKVAQPKHPVAQTHTKGEIAIQPATDTAKANPVPQADTVHPKPVIMGMIAPYHPPTKKKLPKEKVTRQQKNTKTATKER